MRHLATSLLVLWTIAGCALPPPDAYVSPPGARQAGTAVSLGQNSSGEACSGLQIGQPAVTEIYCGAWKEPAAHVQAGEAVSPEEGLQGLATASPWRSGLNLRYACGAPVSTSVLGGHPALLLRCTRLVGGWPQIGLVAEVGGKAWLADGILPALPVMERAIGVQSGLVAQSASTLPQSAADALMANQLAERAFSAGDVGQYEELMALGARTNLAEDFGAAEVAYRSALALQQKALGRNNPNTVTPLMHLALQVSNEGRFPAADILFRQAETLAPAAADRAATARLLHYRALDAVNRGQYEQALALLGQAEQAYEALIPPDIPVNAGAASVGAFDQTAAGVVLPNRRLMVDPGLQSAMLGLIETRRYRSIVLRAKGETRQSQTAIASARTLAASNGMVMPLVSARLSRTAGTTADAAGDLRSADTELALSAASFGQVLPETRPVALTALLRAGESVRQGDTKRAISMCETATKLLRSLPAGTDAPLLSPCFTAYATEAQRRPNDSQALFAAMFEMAELMQDSVTSEQISATAARLAAAARDPKISEAIRRRQDAAENLAELYRARDALAQTAPPGSPPVPRPERDPAELDRLIAKAQTDAADADGALQEAAPNYGQLVQEVVPASAVLAALRPGEAFLSITLTRDGGWDFLLRDGKITAAPVGVGQPQISDLVKRIRASLVLGTAGLPPFDAGAAYAIYQAVVEPVAAPLAGATSLVVAPSGPLLSIPFGSLPTGSVDRASLAAAPWLIRQMTVAHVPAAASFVALRRTAGVGQAQRRWFGFGDFRPVTLAQAMRTFPGAACGDSARRFADLPRLAYAERELNAARQVFGADRADTMLGSEFTAANVARARLKDYQILHFATHALLPVDLRCQAEPAIVTSDPPGASDASGALLGADSVVGLDLNATAVILSACNSGGPNETTAGDSLSGLARAFFYAGARALLVTHWSINDQTSSYLVVGTLRRYADDPGQGLAAALAGAERALLDGAGKTVPAEVAHPYYWAPFALIGEGGALGTRVSTAARMP